MRLGAIAALLVAPAWAGIVQDVRTQLRSGNVAAAEKLLAEFEKRSGVTPELLQAESWLGRHALANRRYQEATDRAVRVHERALELLKRRRLDSDGSLPIALGAAIEVQAQAAAATGERDRAVVFLRGELERYRNTSIRTRIQKNLNLLTLEGKPAPPIERLEWLGARPPSLESLRGRPVVLFLWAHWCGDCKAQAPVLAQIARKFPQLAIVGVTKRYGYAEGGREVGPDEEKRYIEQVRQRSYGVLASMPVALSAETFANYGASTTPTLVLIDRAGKVARYQPGMLRYEELHPAVERLMVR
jgi:thiol-disulfide isomerase/thioredoxin